jgi:condensin complex subunit 2
MLILLIKKINAKNAFDVNVEFLERLPNLINTKEETSWQKASASLDASAKIYGFRVDSVHTETFKFLGGLSRADNKEEDQQVDEGEEGGVKERKNKASDKLVIV